MNALDRQYIAMVLLHPAIRWKYERVSQADLEDAAARAALDAIEFVADSGIPADLVSVSARLRESGFTDIARDITFWEPGDSAPFSVIR